MSDTAAITMVLIVFLIKSPWVWASVVGFLISFKLDGEISNAKKYLLSGCAVVLVASVAKVLLNTTMPIVWHTEGLDSQELSRMIVRYNRIVDIVSASGFLLIVRAVFVSQKNGETKHA